MASAPFPWGGQASKIGPLTSPLRVPSGAPKGPQGSLKGSERVPKGAFEGPGGSPREPSRAPRAPQGSLRGPKGSPREPWKSRNGPQGSLRGPKGSRREPSRVRKGPQGSFNIENTSGFTERTRKFIGFYRANSKTHRVLPIELARPRNSLFLRKNPKQGPSRAPSTPERVPKGPFEAPKGTQMEPTKVRKGSLRIPKDDKSEHEAHRYSPEGGQAECATRLDKVIEYNIIFKLNMQSIHV